jgi:hypothetical protein
MANLMVEEDDGILETARLILGVKTKMDMSTPRATLTMSPGKMGVRGWALRTLRLIAINSHPRTALDRQRVGAT